MGGGTDGRKQDATADERTVGEEPGSGQGEKTDGVGAAHEQPESAGRGNDPDRADLQLNFLEAAIPTEAQQIESIDQAENEKSSSAFVLSQADIEKALRRGSNFENSKLRIWEIYQTQPDRKLRAKALAKEYAPHGPGGCSHTYLDGSSGWLDHDSKGLTFEHYPDHQKIFLRWNQVEKYIDLMMQADRYLTDKEKSVIELYFELNADSAAEYNALKEQYPDALLIFISAPSIDSLRDRLRGRGTEAEDVILKRLKKATEESADMDKYDYIVINDDLEECIQTVNSVIVGYACRTSNNKAYIKEIRDDLKGIW